MCIGDNLNTGAPVLSLPLCGSGSIRKRLYGISYSYYTHFLLDFYWHFIQKQAFFYALILSHTASRYRTNDFALSLSACLWYYSSENDTFLILSIQKSKYLRSVPADLLHLLLYISPVLYQSLYYGKPCYPD